MFRFIDKYHRNPELDYNLKDGSVTKRSYNKSILNQWFLLCKENYDLTTEGSNISVFGLYIAFTVCLMPFYTFMYCTAGAIATPGLLVLLSLHCLLGLAIFAVRPCFLYIPIIITALSIFFHLKVVPTIVEYHVKDCESAQEIIQTGKANRKIGACVFEGYILNNLEKFK